MDQGTTPETSGDGAADTKAYWGAVSFETGEGGTTGAQHGGTGERPKMVMLDERSATGRNVLLSVFCINMDLGKHEAGS